MSEYISEAGPDYLKRIAVADGGPFLPEDLADGGPSLPEDLGQGLEIEPALRGTVLDVEGVSEVRLLPRDRRLGRQRHKVYVVLSAKDLVRDRRIVELMCQFEGIDYDLVPESAVGMIPDGARSV